MEAYVSRNPYRRFGRKIPEHILENYFEVRPRASKLGAHASRQSEIKKDRNALEYAFAKAEKRFENREIPKPKNWGGYLVKPNKIEFRNFETNFEEIQTYTQQENYDWSLKTSYELKEK